IVLKVTVLKVSGKIVHKVIVLKVTVLKVSGKTDPKVIVLKVVLVRVGQINAKMGFVLPVEEVDREVARVRKEVRDKTVRVEAV
ncbi:MAG: hypothetical protein WA118_04860, partial [Carboxydocellales bacterium]